MRADRLDLDALAERVEALVVTLGAEGSVIHADGATYAIPAVQAARRSSTPPVAATRIAPGLLYGIAEGWDWQRTGQLASVMGALKIASRGGQNHTVDRDTVAALYAKAFGEVPF